jgi:hypothetical protein
MSGKAPTGKITSHTVSAFLETMLKDPPFLPEENYRKLCEAWRKSTGADWIWLWLVNTPQGPASTIQLVARSSRAPIPSQTHVVDSQSLTAYCVRKGDIEIVQGKFSNWEKYIGSDKYAIALADELESMGCKQCVCIPVHMPALLESGLQKAPQHMPIITGVVWLHYKKPWVLTAKTHRLLATLGKISAQVLLNSYLTLQRIILIELDKIAHRYLTDRSRDCETISREYAKRVVKVIDSHLQVKGVSLFYRDSLRGGVQCLASSGLMKADGSKVENESQVHYATGEGRTGDCYLTGMPMLLVNGLDRDEKPKTVELIDGKPEFALPATLYPIPLSKGNGKLQKNGGPKALGVIRCKYHHSVSMPGKGLSFDSIELQTLEFIAQQIAPVLETMELNTSRERVVSVTKHDLNAPIGLIRHKIYELRTNKDLHLNKDWVAVNRYDIYDIGVCAMMCLDLVAQLDADPFSFIPKADPEQLSLEARVIAPLKNMLARFADDESEMRVYFEGVDKFPELWLDANLMQRVVFNLITNAVKYGKKKTRIDLVGKIENDAYCVDVCNEGNGIEKGDEEKIFIPRFRSPKTAGAVVGLGLGLPISRACLEKCGCELMLRNRVGPTIFRIRIPKWLTDGPPK